MTLIAQITVNGGPILIGDVLLSSDSTTGLKVNLPLVGDVNQVLAKNGFPFEVSLAQKIHIFDGKIAVSWSGSLIQAERVLRILDRVSRRIDLTLSVITSELEAVYEGAIDQLHLIGLHLSDVVR